jgi:hypothetical protein
MLWYFGEVCKVTFEQSWNAALSCICEEFEKDKKYNVVNSLMRHRNSDGTSLWASKFMEILASKIYEKREASMFAEIEKLVGSSGVGNFFESVSHVQLTTSKTSFNLLSLHKKFARNAPQNLSFKFPERVLRLRQVEDIAGLPIGTYGLPVVSNFPLVDAIVQPNVLLQMTVSEERHRGAVDCLEDIRKGLSEKDPSKHIMVFVVPQKNMKTFKYQNDLQDIQQFVMCPDPVSAISMKQNKGSINDVTAALAATYVSDATSVSTKSKPFQCPHCRSRFKSEQGCASHAKKSKKCQQKKVATTQPSEKL